MKSFLNSGALLLLLFSRLCLYCFHLGCPGHHSHMNISEFRVSSCIVKIPQSSTRFMLRAWLFSILPLQTAFVSFLQHVWDGCRAETFLLCYASWEYLGIQICIYHSIYKSHLPCTLLHGCSSFISHLHVPLQSVLVLYLNHFPLGSIFFLSLISLDGPHLFWMNDFC